MVPRVSVHGLHDLNVKFTTFLKVQWRVGDTHAGGAGSDKNRSKKDKNKSNDGRATEPDLETAGSDDDPLPRGWAIGTMNLRKEPDPDARIIGWVSRRRTFAITGTATSPSGALWYSIEMRNGKQGWVYSRWVGTTGGS
ncbi:hypothetical protein BH24CHL6_BH24CHL6_08080 [soil metagenome]